MDTPDPNDPGDEPARARAVRQRLLERVADADVSHLTVGADEDHWQPFLDGITLKVLHQQDGVLSYLLRLQPGATLPPHRHRCDEECVVLQGRLRVGTRTVLGPGGYHRARAGALHATISSDEGAVVFMRGAVPDRSDVLR